MTLADVAVIVHDLPHREAVAPEVGAVDVGRLRDRLVVREGRLALSAEGRGELIEEEGEPLVVSCSTVGDGVPRARTRARTRERISARFASTKSISMGACAMVTYEAQRAYAVLDGFLFRLVTPRTRGMARWEFKLPDIGEGVAEGEIVQWLVKEGDVVKDDQPMVEIMTDKATVTIAAPKAGRVAELRGKAGQIIQVHAVLVSLRERQRGSRSHQRDCACQEGRRTRGDGRRRHPRNPPGNGRVRSEISCDSTALGGQIDRRRSARDLLQRQNPRDARHPQGRARARGST